MQRRIILALGAAFGTCGVAFAQPVPRSVQSKLREHIIPEDFGCVGDGVTDDSTNMTAAAAAAIGKTLKLSPGKTYLLTAVDIPASARTTFVDMTGAVVKSKVLAAGNGSPIFNVTGAGRATFLRGEIEGQRSSQPADGFSDSFNTGGGGKGRAYRAAIKADATVATGVAEVQVINTKFKGMYGACIATFDVPDVRCENCEATDTNFELGFFYCSAATLNSAVILGNKLKNLGSGHLTVNADGFVVSRYRTLLFDGNYTKTQERCMIKVENCKQLVFGVNTIDENTVDNFPGVQIVASSGFTVESVVIGTLNTVDTGKGIYFVGPGSLDTVTIGAININGTSGSTSGDGLVSDAVVGQMTIGVVNARNIRRHGIHIANQVTRSLTISGGVLRGQDANQAILLNASGGSWGDVVIKGVRMGNFEASAAGEGVLVLARSSSNTFARLICEGNVIDAGSASNRGLRIANAAADYVATGIIDGNVIVGQLEHYSVGLETKNGNLVSGTVTVPSKTFVPS